MWTSRNRIVCEKTIINQQSGRMQESVAHIILFSRCLIATNISTASDSTNHTYHVGYFPMFSFVCSFVCWCFLEMGGRRGWGCGIPPHMMCLPPPDPQQQQKPKTGVWPISPRTGGFGAEHASSTWRSIKSSSWQLPLLKHAYFTATWLRVKQYIAPTPLLSVVLQPRQPASTTCTNRCVTRCVSIFSFPYFEAGRFVVSWDCVPPYQHLWLEPVRIFFFVGRPGSDVQPCSLSDECSRCTKIPQWAVEFLLQACWWWPDVVSGSCVRWACLEYVVCCLLSHVAGKLANLSNAKLCVCRWSFRRLWLVLNREIWSCSPRVSKWQLSLGQHAGCCSCNYLCWCAWMMVFNFIKGHQFIRLFLASSLLWQSVC